MQILEGTVLDYLWRVLVFGSMVVTVSYLMPAIIQMRIFKISPQELKKIWQFFHSQVLFILSFTGLYLYFNQQTVIKCFEFFIKNPDTVSLTRYLVHIWLGGITIVFAFDLFGLTRSFMKFKVWKNSDDLELTYQVKQLSEKMRLNFSPKVLTQEDRQSPFVFGLLKPVIVFPKGFSKAVDVPALRSIIAHELVHIKNADAVWNLLEYLIRRIFFFNPFIYLFQAMYKDIQEKSADQQAIEILNIKKSDFVCSFFQMIDFCKSSSGPISLSMSSAASFRHLKSRMQFLAEANQKQKKQKTLFLFVLCFLLSSAWSYVEAKNSIFLNSKFNEAEPNMCIQAQHEMALEKLFDVESIQPIRRCE